VFLGYLVMSFADGIGVVVARISEAYRLPKGVAAALPSLIFAWFAFLSVPTGSLCARFGRHRIATGSLWLTAEVGRRAPRRLPRQAWQIPCRVAVGIKLQLTLWD